MVVVVAAGLMVAKRNALGGQIGAIVNVLVLIPAESAFVIKLN
jgi:hypothetical protein